MATFPLTAKKPPAENPAANGHRADAKAQPVEGSRASGEGAGIAAAVIVPDLPDSPVTFHAPPRAAATSSSPPVAAAALAPGAQDGLLEDPSSPGRGPGPQPTPQPTPSLTMEPGEGGRRSTTRLSTLSSPPSQGSAQSLPMTASSNGKAPRTTGALAHKVNLDQQFADSASATDTRIDIKSNSGRSGAASQEPVDIAQAGMHADCASMPGLALRGLAPLQPGVVARTPAEVEALRDLFQTAQALTQRRENPIPATRLDQLYTLYLQHVPRSLQQRDVQRTIATLKALLVHDVSPEKLQSALTWAARRDAVAQVVAGMIGYSGSWFVGTTVALEMVRAGFKPTTALLTSAVTTGFGTRLMTRWLRLTDSGPSWRAVVGVNAKEEVVPALRTRTGFAMASAAYWPFLGTLFYITATMPHPARALTSEEAGERSLAILDARRMLNYVATLGVAIHRYLSPTLSRAVSSAPLEADPVWLDGKNERRLIGAVDQLSGGASAFAMDAGRAALRLLIPCAVGDRRAHDSKSVPNTLNPFRLSLEGRDLGMLMVLIGVVAATGLIRSLGSDPDVAGGPHTGQPPSMTQRPLPMEYVADTFLVLAWGVAMAWVDRVGMDEGSVATDSKRVADHRWARVEARGARLVQQSQPVPAPETGQPADGLVGPGGESDPEGKARSLRNPGPSDSASPDGSSRPLEDADPDADHGS